MARDLSFTETKKEWHGTFKSYAIGFIASLLLTSASFFLVLFKSLSGNLLVYSLIALAIAQAIVQLIFFLHVGQEDKPKWETLLFGFTVIVLLIIIIGSLWIMNDLNERTMSTISEETSRD